MGLRLGLRPRFLRRLRAAHRLATFLFLPLIEFMQLWASRRALELHDAVDQPLASELMDPISMPCKDPRVMRLEKGRVHPAYHELPRQLWWDPCRAERWLVCAPKLLRRAAKHLTTVVLVPCATGNFPSHLLP